jgi:hypothetical protein
MRVRANVAEVFRASLSTGGQRTTLVCLPDIYPSAYSMEYRTSVKRHLGPVPIIDAKGRNQRARRASQT